MRSEAVSTRLPVPVLRLNRLAVFFAALLGCIFVGAGYTAIDHEREHMEQVLGESAEAESRWIGLLLAESLDAALRSAPVPGAAGSGMPALDPAARAAVDRALARLKTLAPILDVRLIDREGRVIYASDPTAADLRPVDARRLAEAARDGPWLEIGARDLGAGSAAGGVRRRVTVLHANLASAGGTSPVAAIESRLDISAADVATARELESYRNWVVGVLGGFYLMLVLGILWGTMTIHRLASAREAAVAAINEGRQLLVDGLESMSDAVLMVDSEFRVQIWNAAYLRFFPHLSRVLRRNLPWRAIVEMNAATREFGIAPAERAAWIEETYRRLTTRTDDFRRTLTDGRTWIVMTRQTASGGRIQTIRDVTAELAAQRDLAAAKQLAEESETHLRDAVESLSDGFSLLDASQRVVLWNSRYPVLLPPLAAVLRRGATLRELVATLPGSPLYAIPPEQHEAWITAAVPRLWDGPPFIRRLANGRYLRIACTPTRTGGRILALRDVTDDVQAKEKIERLALVAERTDNAVVILDSAGQVEWVNAGFERLTGYALEDVLGREPTELFKGPDTDAATLTAMREAVAHGRGYDVEILSYTRDRKPYWVQIACTPVRNEQGTTIRLVAIALEITARKEQERRLSEALARERELVTQQRHFVAVTAHEFRTPLTIIDGAAQRLARYADHIVPGDLRERAARIRAAVQRMAELVDTTLNSARLDEGRIEIDVGPIDLVELVGAVARRLAGVASDFRISVSSAAAAVPIEGDARLLDQVFANLISNAIKYSGASRRIDVAVSGDDIEAEVRVRDYGIGIPAAEIDRLFTRYFRASTARGLPGTGIGLNLVKELVALHGGDVQVESRLGEGTTFIVSLPARPRPLAASAVAAG
ncbi:MAG: PAS-domain containing protein [Alphaproteobacteria bacterium]|nr:PAS-domain containing protein [Alphaproteobacteria bacterium]